MQTKDCITSIKRTPRIVVYDTWHMEDRGLSSRAGGTNVCMTDGSFMFQSISFIATFQLDVLLQVVYHVFLLIRSIDGFYSCMLNIKRYVQPEWL